MNTAGIIRNILLIDIILLALFALFYLRQRRMSCAAYWVWGLLALILPVLGPFLVIVNRPGEWHPDPFPSMQLRQKVRMAWQGLVREIHYQQVRRAFRRGLKERRSKN